MNNAPRKQFPAKTDKKSAAYTRTPHHRQGQSFFRVIISSAIVSQLPSSPRGLIINVTLPRSVSCVCIISTCVCVCASARELKANDDAHYIPFLPVPVCVCVVKDATLVVFFPQALYRRRLISTDVYIPIQTHSPRNRHLPERCKAYRLTRCGHSFLFLFRKGWRISLCTIRLYRVATGNFTDAD